MTEIASALLYLGPATAGEVRDLLRTYRQERDVDL
jgi:hypothetical protein